MKKHYLKERLTGIAILLPFVVFFIIWQVYVIIEGLPLTKQFTWCSLTILLEGIVLTFCFIVFAAAPISRMTLNIVGWALGNIFDQPTSLKQDIVIFVTNFLKSDGK